MKKLLYILPLFILIACEQQSEEDIYFTTLIGVPNAFVTKLEYKSHTNYEISLEMDVGIVNSRSRDVTNILDSSFKRYNSKEYGFEIDTVYQYKGIKNSDYSTLLIFDLSSSNNDVDPMNQRLRASRKFLQTTDSNDNRHTAIGVFARNGNLSSSFLIVVGEDRIPFQGDSWQGLTEYLYFRTYYDGGTSCIYDAIDYGISWVSKYAPSDNKSITIFSHNTDDGEGLAYEEVIQKAIDSNIRVNIISVGEKYHWHYYEICQKTGGFITIISNTTLGGYMDKGTPMIGDLSRILMNDLNLYKVKFRIVRKKTALFTSGRVIGNYIYVDQQMDDGSEWVSNILPFYIKLP